MGAADSLQRSLQRRLERDPDGRALAFYDAKRNYEWMSFGEVYGRAAATAAALADLGLARNEPCVIVLPSGEPAARMVLGATLHGSLPLLVAPPALQGMNSDLPRILARTVSSVGARLVIVADRASELIAELQQTMPDVRFVPEAALPSEIGDGTGPPALPGSSDVAALQLTSGTTGFPRIVEWSHAAVLAALKGMVEAMQVDRDDIYLNWTPLYHDMGLVNNFWVSLIHDIPLVMQSPHDFVKRPSIWLQGLSDTGATMTWAPNFGFALAAQRIPERDLTGVRLDGVRALWNAAERIHLQTMLDFHHRFEHLGLDFDALKTNFGCAENVGGATFSDPDGPFIYETIDRDKMANELIAEPLPADDARAVPIVSAGRPHAEMKVHILSGSAEELGDGQIGEIALDTPSRMTRYVNDEAATNRALVGGLLRTGDLGYLRGGEVFWVGRVQERINVRGRKIDPSDFESVLFDVPELRTGCFAAFGVDDTHAGTQRLVIVSEVREPLDAPTELIESAIRERCLSRLGIQPSDIVLVASGTLAKTSSGKRRHRHFRELYVSGGLDRYEVSGG